MTESIDAAEAETTYDTLQTTVADEAGALLHDVNTDQEAKRQESKSGVEGAQSAEPYTSLRGGQSNSPGWFARDPSKAYYEKISLIWAPLSMIILLVGVLATPLYKYCDRDSFLAISVAGCLPGVLIPLLFPCEADKKRRLSDRFWVKGTIWIAIFGFYGNYFWTHYFYQLLGAEYLFDSYKLNEVPLVTFTCTFFYFTFYFNFVNLILRRIAYWTDDFPQFGRSLIWWIVIITLSYGTALFEAVSIEHFPLYTYTDRDTFVFVGSIVYGLYFVVGFPMFFSIDEQKLEVEEDEVQCGTHTLGEAMVNALAATALVTLFLDLWRLFLGSIYNISSFSDTKLPFIYQETEAVASASSTTFSSSECTAPLPSPEIIYVQQPVTVDACVGVAKSWTQKQLQSVASQLPAW